MPVTEVILIDILPLYQLQPTFLIQTIVWILGHVLTGWDGTNPLRNPTNLCKLPSSASSAST